jgi:hypothetical protein
MLFLASVSDKVSLAVSPGVALDVHASFMDSLGSTVTPGRENTKTTTETAVDVVLAPPASTVRSVKTLHIMNKEVSAPADVTVEHRDGVSVIELSKATLAAGEKLQYVEGQGFRVYDADGAIK